ncbi:MAG: putative periplasmic serine endoprotease DegP-like precursor [Planctomycetota bacterium]
MRNLAILVVTALLASFAGPANRFACADKPPRFAAMMSNGTRIEGQALSEGHAATPTLKLDGQALLDPGNPARWVKDRAQAPAPLPKAFVEFTSGDRLPGAIVGFRDGTEQPYDPLPPHFLVRPEITLATPSPGSDAPLRVLARFVRRLVWQRRDRDDFQPSTVLLRDGRSLPYRAARFGDGLVNLLVADGQRKIYFSEIAEIHFPTNDSWSNYFDEISLLSPTGATRLFQIETNQGLTLTSSFERFFSRGDGGPQNFLQWIHGLQPAWSLDLLWVPSSTIWMRRFFMPHEVPLSRRWPGKSVEKSLLSGTGRKAQPNRNVQQGPLHSGGQDFGWGFGVHATSELHFELPSSARIFRTSIGLDRVAGRGGCVRARVFADGTPAAPLFESPFLVGSQQAVATGDLRLETVVTSQKRLVLQVDPAHDGRPAGTDPFDIRDMADWLDPMIELDANLTKAELANRPPNVLSVWNGWTLTSLPIAGQAPGGIEWQNQWDDAAALPGCYLCGSVSKNQELAFEREMSIGSNDQWLVVSAFHASPPAQPGRLEVRVNGEPVAEYALPLRNRSLPDPRPLIVPLRAYRNHAVHLQIVQGPTTTPVVWRAVRVIDRLPMLYEGFDEEGAFQAVGDAGNRSASVTNDERFCGVHSVHVPPGASWQLKFPRPIAIRERPQWGEYRYLTFAVRRRAAGRFSIEFNTQQERELPVRYDGGRGPPSLGESKRVFQDQLPDQWVEFPRDLYADFGPIEITGITLHSLDDQPTWFDRIYLARLQNDFELINILQPAALAPQQGQIAVLPGLLGRMSPATVSIQFADGLTSSGLLLTADGDVLTAGHCCFGPNRQATIRLSDGRVAEATTRGVDRSRDLGLLKISTPGPWPAIDMPAGGDLPRNLMYFGIGYSKGSTPGAPPLSFVADLRRVVRETISAELDWHDLNAGSLLVDQNARVVGVLSQRGQFGGHRFTRYLDPATVLPRLRAGESWGEWPAGLEPRWGATSVATDSGCKIESIDSDSAAAAANLKPGDIVQKVQQQSVVKPRDIDAVLRGLDPGTEITLSVLRQGKTFDQKLRLSPVRP